MSTATPDPARLPIAVFDSGVGGLSILRALVAHLPHEHFLYVADNAWLPYGARSQEEIQQRLLIITQHLLERGIKALVIACNTATAAAIDHIRACFPELIVVGVEPAIKPACALTRSGVVGVLATEHTVASARFQNLIRQYAQGVQVIGQACPGWVEFVESGNPDATAAQDRVRPQIDILLSAGADVLVLGCTHYPFLEPAIRSIAEAVTIIETGMPVARQVQRLLEERQLLTMHAHPALDFFTTAPGKAEVFAHLLGDTVRLQSLEI
ncbi:MAG: glutamate racemase [Burkholderiaceae bacterium]|nr:MAG: glutamate racemase [Burkholderiaceae bacterium]